MKSTSRILAQTIVLILAMIAGTTTSASQVVISQVYGGGGNSGATYTHDFIELLNVGIAPVDLSTWSVQYASATGSTWQVTSLTGSVPGLSYYLIQQAQGAGGSQPLPTPDATGTIAMAAGAGKVALCNSTTALTGSCPTGGAIVDFAGYGPTANCFEGTGPTSAPSNTNAVARKNDGSLDTDDNATDFEVIAPLPRNSSNPPLPVQLASFTGRVNPTGNGVLLEWRTISEINNYGFYVERRHQNERTFSDVQNGFVPGHGTTNEPQEYSFIDNTMTTTGVFAYRLRQVDFDGTFERTEPIEVNYSPTSVPETAPRVFQLLQNYPNPFNPTTEIKFSVEKAGRATLEIFNLLGQKIATLFDDVAEAGQYNIVQFNAAGLSSGVYFYRLVSGDVSDLKKLVLLK